MRTRTSASLMAASLTAVVAIAVAGPASATPDGAGGAATDDVAPECWMRTEPGQHDHETCHNLGEEGYRDRKWDAYLCERIQVDPPNPPTYWILHVSKGTTDKRKGTYFSRLECESGGERGKAEGRWTGAWYCTGPNGGGGYPPIYTYNLYARECPAPP